MKTVVLGSGAMGCLYGGLLAEAGHEVTLVDIWREHVAAINSVGLKIETADGSRAVRNVRGVINPDDAGSADLLLVFVKATQTERAMRNALSLVAATTTVLTLQNGLGNAEKLCQAVGPSRVIAGTTGHGATLLGPGRIFHAGTGDTVIGEPDGRHSARVEQLASVFRGAGIAAATSDNINGLIWTKLIVNAGINALTALTGLKNGRLLDFPETERLMAMAVEEALAVAAAKGIRLEAGNLVEYTRQIALKTAGNRSSLLQDVLAKRQTEIAVINGAVVEEAEKLGVPVPVNIVLANLISVRQKTYDEASFL